MKALLFHCKKFNTKITGISTRGVEVEPETINSKKENNYKKSIVCFITVERGDNVKENADKIYKEINRFCNETKENNIILCPFAHLSNKLASFKVGISFFNVLEKKLKEKFKVNRMHFGSDKELIIHIFGHPGNARYREF